MTSKITNPGQWKAGYRFHPTDEELVDNYLKLKMLGHDQLVSNIAEVHVCNFEPWDLPKLSAMETIDPVWFFFSPPDYKYSKSQRANRKTKTGFWKITGKDRKVRMISNSGTIQEIGTKKTLVFYEGRSSNGVKTDWVMHEYHSNFSFPNQRDFVLCKLKKKEDEEDTPISDAEDTDSLQMDSDSIIDAPAEDSQLKSYLDSFRGYDASDYNLESALQSPVQNGESSS